MSSGAMGRRRGRRLHGGPTAPFTPGSRAVAPRGIPLDPRNPRDARDRPLLLIGFAGTLRRSELVALTLADVQVDSEGLRIPIALSKTDPRAVGHTRGLSYGAGPATCPVRAWQTWLHHRLPSPTVLSPELAGSGAPSPEQRPASRAGRALCPPQAH